MSAESWQHFHRWAVRPEDMVREEFKVEPDAWQLEALRAFPEVNRLALKACKGPGKTAVLAWLIINFLMTRPHPRVAATSITGDNLHSNLWPELAKWIKRSEVISGFLVWTKTKVMHRYHPETWWCQARTWPKKADPQQQTDSLAGLHEDYAMFVVDESGGLPQALMTTVEAVLSGGVETKVLQAGNPISRDGPLYRACVTDRGLWRVIEITGDPDRKDRSPRISLKYARDMIAAYGRDNPWVMVNILGQFPPQAINALLGDEEVARAMKRHLPKEAYAWAQKRLGIDVARFGDDRDVFFPRQGPVAFRPAVFRFPRGATVSTDLAAKAIAFKRHWGSEVEFLDATGGWAAGCRDVMVTAGVNPHEVQFAAPALDRAYFNRRSEIHFGLARWVKSGGCLPPVPELIAELTEPTYTFRNGKFFVEPKEFVKARIGRSPDLADALATTFALPDEPANRDLHTGRRLEHRPAAVTEWDPYAIDE